MDPIPRNLMFVRVRTNTWNVASVVEPAVQYYTSMGVPVVLTFMAYYKEDIKTGHERYYILRTRTTNEYKGITTAGWDIIMSRFKYETLVHSCGTVEGEIGKTRCACCGNCLREFFATMERLRGDRSS